MVPLKPFEASSPYEEEKARAEILLRIYDTAFYRLQKLMKKKIVDESITEAIIKIKFLPDAYCFVISVLNRDFRDTVLLKDTSHINLIDDVFFEKQLFPRAKNFRIEFTDGSDIHKAQKVYIYVIHLSR